jgi:hypothetical protein
MPALVDQGDRARQSVDFRIMPNEVMQGINLAENAPSA